jgi:rabenosyn-5
MDAFAQYNVAARRLRDLPTVSPTQLQLQKAIFQQATNFLHVHMLPLKALPKLMKHASAHGMGDTERPLPHSKGGGSLKPVMQNEQDSVSQASSNSAISALEAEEKALRERLIVLEEQSFLVKEQIVVANKRRKFDEVSSLAQNVEDLSQEIDRVQGQLAQLDFAGLYSGQPASKG